MKTPNPISDLPAKATLVIVLSFGAGCVDAAGFLTAGVFPANMTGNSVLLALALGRAAVSDIGMAGGVLLAFCAGAAWGYWWLRGRSSGWSTRLGKLFLQAAALLGIAATVHFLALPNHIGTLLTACAMGVQACAVQQIGVAGVSTVVVTNTLLTAIRSAVGHGTPEERSHGWVAGGSWAAYFGGAIAGALLVGAVHASAAMILAAAALGLAAWRGFSFRG